MSLSREDVENILRIIESPCTELHLETADFKLFVRKGGDARGVSSPVPQSSGSSFHSAVAGETRNPIAAPSAERAPAAAQPARASKAPRALAADESSIVAPMVGTFYRAPSPGAPPFVEVGDVVEPETVVCIIEVMKLMNSIRADRRGRVVEILVDNAQPVDSGQPLIILGTAA